MIVALDLQDNQLAQKVLALQKVCYQQEAKLIHFQEIPPLQDTLASLQRSEEKFYGYQINQQIVGTISYKKLAHILDIHRLMVAPSFSRRGIAQNLVEFVQKQYQDIHKVIVTTPQRNYPAVNLYHKMGFMVTRKKILPEGLLLCCFEKELC